MACRVLVEREAVDRLAELGLSVELIERVIRRADAEASTCTSLDPPILEGLTRWGRTTRFLREELIPAGWGYDNPRNLARTIHPSGQFAIVVTSGDELTGVAGQLGQADLRPATKYPKGYATVRAVEHNEQLTLDFDDFHLPEDARATDPGALLTRLLMFHIEEDGFRVELSLPDAIVDGRITSWAERIILPVFPREDDMIDTITPDKNNDDDQDGGIVVEVNPR